MTHHPDSAPLRPGRLADRLDAARRSRFVGRHPELALLRAALAADEPPFAVLHVTGPGGVGKSTLLREFARLAEEAGRPVIAVDGRDLDATAAERFDALRDRAERSAPALWLIDTYETLTALDPWLREMFLPQLPARSLVVIAGRNRPDPAWRTDLAWAPLTRTIELGNLVPAESETYLANRGLPADAYAAALAASRGHPLALALIADALAAGESPDAFDFGTEPDVVRVLVERLVSQTPSPAHRQALEACSLLWATTETVLAACVDAGRAHELFAWLRGLSCIEQGPFGLIPHELARDVLQADFRWRDPAGYQLRVASLFRHLYESLAPASAPDQQRIWFGLFSLLRHHPYFGPFFEWSAFGNAAAEPARPDHADAILAMVRRYEGDASARIAAYWLARQPDAFLVFRESFGSAIFGFMAHLEIHAATTDDRAADPAIAAAFAHVERHGAPVPDRELLHLRFWMHAEKYQGVSPALNLAAITSSIHWTTRPHLAWNFVAVADPTFHEPHFTGIHLWRAEDAEFVVDGHAYAVFAHDWQLEPAATWMDQKIDSPVAGSPAVDPWPIPSKPESVAMPRPEFDAAVRQALRDYTRADHLLHNPLVGLDLGDGPATDLPAVRLRAALRDAVAALAANPKDLKLHRALWHTFIEPAPTQELAAELLGLPFNTYRYHLAKGIERVANVLWVRAYPDR